MIRLILCLSIASLTILTISASISLSLDKNIRFVLAETAEECTDEVEAIDHRSTIDELSIREFLARNNTPNFFFASRRAGAIAFFEVPFPPPKG